MINNRAPNTGSVVRRILRISKQARSSDLPTVAVVYHFFAHYRSAVLDRLLHSQSYSYLFAGDLKDPTNSGIKEWTIPSSADFVVTPCWFIRGRYLVQPGALRLAWRGGVQTVIFLGDAQFLTTWLAAVLARVRGKRVLFWTHGWIRSESGLKDGVRCAFYRLAHGLLLYGQRAREMAVQRGFQPDKLYVVYNSLDYETQRRLRDTVLPEAVGQLRRELFGDAQRPVLICTGRLVRSRKLDLLLQALGELGQQGHPVNLILVGEGPEHANLEALATRYGVVVKFYGECYAEERLALLIMSANASVIPSGAGLTILHSLAYGVPVLTHDNASDQGPEWEAIIAGTNGDYFRQDDVHDMARVILNWTRAEQVDESVRERCYEVVEMHYNAEYQRRVIEHAISGGPARQLEPS